MPIDPAHFEALSRMIGDAFDPDEMDIVLRKTTGGGLFKVWAGPGKPMRDTIVEVLRKLSDRGIERAVLTEIAIRRRDQADLIAALGAACPAALEALPTTAAQVGTLLTGLTLAQASLADPAVRAALTASRAALQILSQTTGTLRIYKEIHDSLHQLQMKQFNDLRGAARTLGTDPAQEAELVDYQTRLDSACTEMRDWIGQLPDTGLARPLELAWLERLEAANRGLHQALADQTPAPAMVALTDIHRLMATVPSRLNEQIVVAAETLPLGTLADALNAVAGATAGAPGDVIGQARAALGLIDPALHARVGEHKSWQEIDNRIRYMDELADHRGPGMLAEFAIYWPDLKRSVLDLASFDPAAPWARDTNLYAGRLDDLLARDVLDDALLAAFANFRVKARFRFFAVDRTLKDDCSALVSISAPLNSIVAELADAP